MNPKKILEQLKFKSLKKYEVLKGFFLEKMPAEKIAKQFNYKISTIYSMVRDFRKICDDKSLSINYFLENKKPGPKPSKNKNILIEAIVELRKKYLSVADIKAILDARNLSVSEQQIYQILCKEGFERLPRRSNKNKNELLAKVSVKAPSADLLGNKEEIFNSGFLGILCFIPYLIGYDLHKIIENSLYPETKTIPKLNSILCFLALKLSNIQRYAADDLWCMDRGLGLFAGLNVLPKTGWFSSYSHRVTKEMNIDFLKKLHNIWVEAGILSDTINLDFVSLPYWGEDTHLENNWSGTRRHALTSILAALAQDPETGIITHADATIRHDKESQIITEFVDFYKKEGSGSNLRYLVFDSKFTTYENLKSLNEKGVYFLTIRRRGKNIIKDLENLTSSEWKKLRVLAAGGKSRSLQINESKIQLRGYGKKLVRQIAIKGHGKIKPALIITNDFESSTAVLVRKYARRWLVEKTISEQTHFFHLNRLSSSMVIKVDFDLVMTILAYNLYRLFSMDLPGYEHCTASTIYKKFIYNSGVAKIDTNFVMAQLKKKRHHPTLMFALQTLENTKIPWLYNRKLKIKPASNS